MESQHDPIDPTADLILSVHHAGKDDRSALVFVTQDQMDAFYALQEEAERCIVLLEGVVQGVRALDRAIKKSAGKISAPIPETASTIR